MFTICSRFVPANTSQLDLSIIDEQVRLSIRIMSITQTALNKLHVRPSYSWGQLRGDILGGLTAGSIVLPASVGYGVISGLGPVAGLYGAAAVSLFAALFGGTRGMISGPNILVTLTMAAVVSQYADSLAEAASAAILAGLIQMGFGALRLGRYVSYIPYSLIAGFFTAFGILLIIKQGLLALGASPGGTALDSIRAMPDAIRDANLEALAVAVFCVVLGVAWRGKLLKIAPSQFAVLVCGTILAVLFFAGAPTIGTIPQGLPAPELPAFSLDTVIRLAQPAFAMALLSSLSTLIVALPLDTITGVQHKPNQELGAQGIGNVAAGLIGGLPGGVTPGTFANAFSGGRTQVAGLTVAALIISTILFLGPIAERIPLAVLAGILFINGWNIIDWRFIKRLHRVPADYVIVMALTCFLVLFVDITLAVVAGVVVSALTGARRREKLETEALISAPILDSVLLDGEVDPFEARAGIVIFPDRVTVASTREVSRIVRADILGHQVVIFDMSRTMFIDDSAAVVITDLIRIAVARRQGRVVIAGLTRPVTETLDAFGLRATLPEGLIVPDMDAARGRARDLLTSG